MTKQEFIEAVSKKTKLPKSEVSEVVNTGIEVITQNINKGIVFTGFGTFTVSKRKARTGRNPKTGETIKIPAMKVPRFKAGKVLKEAVK
ncbi:MAG TPA: HU family DNA-binding protein [Candidatus Pacearchaeota archaeon]|nr:HU family DNA-binding protein [Candidatus Pacearchaeota archaeon]HOK94391.1 HU family DNA-binding protein [Candidatus Pacearchaeota archaeon]HPO75270.1 HU family DNA-binding protein [Candidatus Pacearchaeota archaeon]